MAKRKFNLLFEKIAAEEQKFFNSDFLSPVLRGKMVRVRISNIVLPMQIVRPKNYEGWGIFHPINIKTARRVRDATMAEKQEYLNLFPTLRLIVVQRGDQGVYGIPANASSKRFHVTGAIPIRLPQEVQMFETVVTRFDGENCWYDRGDSSANLRSAAVLRDALTNMTDVEKVTSSGMTLEEKQAYTTAFIRELENRKDRNEERIKDVLSRAGAQYRSYVERGNVYTVEYLVEGESHTSTVDKQTLGVQSAGICLSGGDRVFDLQSLVGVIREGIRRRAIHRVGLDRTYGYNMVDNEEEMENHENHDNDDDW